MSDNIKEAMQAREEEFNKLATLFKEKGEQIAQLNRERSQIATRMEQLKGAHAQLRELLPADESKPLDEPKEEPAEASADAEQPAEDPKAE